MPTSTHLEIQSWTDQFDEYAERSPQMQIIVDLAKENPLEHSRIRSAWWDLLANSIIVMIVERDIVSIAETHLVLTMLQEKGLDFSISHQEIRKRLQGYIDILQSAKTHF